MKKLQWDAILWDFNGTLLDDVDTGIKSVNTMLARRSLPIIESREKYYEVFGFPIKNYYERLGFDFEKEPYEQLAIEWVDEYLENVKSATLREGAGRLLEFFRSVGVEQTIISMTERDMLISQVESLGIGHYFSEIMGLDNIHANSKTALAAKWREAHPAAKALFIGDTSHDAESALAAQADCVIVAGGHQSLDSLSGCNVFCDFDSLLSYFESEI